MSDPGLTPIAYNPCATLPSAGTFVRICDAVTFGRTVNQPGPAVLMEIIVFRHRRLSIRADLTTCDYICPNGINNSVLYTPQTSPVKTHIMKVSPYKCAYHIVRAAGSSDRIELDVKTDLTHNMTHLVAEQVMHITHGFRGLVAARQSFAQINDKSDLSTETLRRIEGIAGSVQSAYEGRIREQDFAACTAHPDNRISTDTMRHYVVETGSIIRRWQTLETGGTLILNWTVPTPSCSQMSNSYRQISLKALPSFLISAGCGHGLVQD